ncbi:hypothetical protein [Nannocystis sp.]|uniref:hypothetical protein n=1 Tax=Nannocystis sp. TaxID=1962667 RepID=UPI0025E91D08|nr:hypothetical protein [Nannocystis sp.]MBK7824267.1 hypothetical protein [Nannocystis sp.]
MSGPGDGRGARLLQGAGPLLGLAALLLYAFPYAERTRNASELPRLLQGMAIVDSGSFAIDGLAGRGLAAGPDVARGVAGGLYPNKPPGAGLVAAAAYVAARASAGEALTLRRYTWWGRLLAGVLPTLLLCAALARRLRAAFGAHAAWLGLGLYALATPAFAYAHLLYGHQLTACLLTIGALWVVEGVRGDRWRTAGAGGLLCGAALAVEYSAAFAGLAIAGFVLAWLRRGRGRAGLAASLGAALPIGLLAWYHAAVYGGPLRTGYHNAVNPEFAAKHGEGFLGLVAPSWTGVHAQLLSSEAGLLWWAPLSLAALAGLWDMSRGPDDTALRSHARVQLAMFLLLLLTCVSLNFEGGWRVGPRYLVAVMPALALGLAGAARWLTRARPLAWLLTAALLTWSAIINGLAASLWPHFDLTNIHQPVSEVLLPLWRAGRTPYTLAGGVTLPIALGLLGLLWLLAPRGRVRVAATIVGVAAGIGMVAATRLIAPHPRSAANLAYIERVWEPPIAGGTAPSVQLGPVAYLVDPEQAPPRSTRR